MLKGLAIVAFMCPLIVIGILAVKHVLKGTPEQGIAKSDSGQKGHANPDTQSNDQSAPKPIPSAPQPAAPTCDEPCQNARQNLQIQKALVWLTGGLVFVGLLQVVSITWQAIVLKRTRADIHFQANQMKKQTGILIESATATRQSADALVNAERPWVDVVVNSVGDETFDFVARNYGRTPAEIMSSIGDCVIIVQEEDIPILTDRKDDLFDEKSLLLPYSKSADQSVFELAVYSASPANFLEDLSDGIQRRVHAGEKYLAIYGIVVYEDILTRETHHTRFCYLWDADTSALNRWGPEGANEHT